MNRVLLIDTQILTQTGLIQIIERQGLVVQTLNPGELTQAVTLTATIQPDLLIADPFFDPGFSLKDLASIVSNQLKLPVLVIFNPVNKVDIAKLMEAGLQCLLAKTASAQEIAGAIDAAILHKKYYCSYTAELLSVSDKDVMRSPLPALSVREKEIIFLIAEGLPDITIADKLSLSFHTVRTHRKNIIKKLGVNLKNAAELVFVINALNELI